MSDEWQFIKCHLVRDCDDYIAQLDEYRRGKDIFHLGHIGMKRWTPGVFKRLMRDWQVFRSVVAGPLFCTAEVEDDKFHRFVKHFGFVPFMPVKTLNGSDRTLFFCPPTHVPIVSINAINDTN